MPAILYEKPATGYATWTIKGENGSRDLTLEVTHRLYVGKNRCKPCAHFTK